MAYFLTKTSNSRDGANASKQKYNEKDGKYLTDEDPFNRLGSYPQHDYLKTESSKQLTSHIVSGSLYNNSSNNRSKGLREQSKGEI